MKNTTPLTEQDFKACMIADRDQLRSRFNRLKRQADDASFSAKFERLLEQLARSKSIATLRKENLPTPDFPENLPISQKQLEIAEQIKSHQVIILCGETGSGKSTQLPKICLTLGRGIYGRIGHTQPRRIAARALAARISEELGCELGTSVGFKVRFQDHVKPETHIKLLTDGMLLAEVQRDPLLKEYDTLIIDEAHERSLNIDFLLGTIQQLLPKRPDLKVIITSATIDPDRFSRQFNNAPIINVTGRTFPVEVRYRPPASGTESEPGTLETFNERDEQTQQAIVDAVDELSRADRGDILLFLSGEREIRETAETLRKHKLPLTEILPLYARMGAADQARIFKPSAHRRIILSTNVAETSLTVPGIRYVIDVGFARISRYSHKSKVQRLPVERISQASANQRMGRCGRVADGICIRLFSEEDFASRSEFTEPEILRTNLASVILQMKILRFGEIEQFPFVDAPDDRLIKDGYRILEEIGAVDGLRQVTDMGRKLAKLPIDPRLGRMLLESVHNNCLKDMLVIAAALSVQDPRDRPHDKQQAADQAHRPFVHEESDFLSYVKLWNHLEQQRDHLSKRKYRHYCRDQFLSWTRMQEWHDIHRQLRGQMHEMGYMDDKTSGRMSLAEQDQQLNNNAPLIHRAVLSGMLSHIGVKASGADREYLAARNAKFYIFPGSGLFKVQPKWVVAAELVETTRLYARNVAQVQPEWIESMAEHLVKRSYSEPHWEKKRGQVAAYEKVTLFGLVLSPSRKINYGPVNKPKSVLEAHEIFLRSALVEGDFHSRLPFWQHNQKQIESIQQMEAKSRRRDLLVDEDQLYAYYQSRIPKDIYSTPQFEKWLKKASKSQPGILHMDREDLLRKDQQTADQHFPNTLELNGMQLQLNYRFDPTHQADGVTLKIPRAVLNQLTEERCQWLVPGLLLERIIALLRGLPKPLRKQFVPIPATAQACLNGLKPSGRPLIRDLAERLKQLHGVHVPEDAWNESAIPTYLRLNLHVLDDEGRKIDAGRDLALLKQKHGNKDGVNYQQFDSNLQREGLKRWDFGDLPESVELTAGGIRLRGFPALLDQGDCVDLKVLDSQENAAAVNRMGIRRLILLELSSDIRYLRKNLPGLQVLVLQYAKVAKPPIGLETLIKTDLQTELIALIMDQTFLQDRPVIRNAKSFEQRISECKPELMNKTTATLELVRSILQVYQKVRKSLSDSNKLNWVASVSDIGQQLDRLIFKGFLQHTGYRNLQQFPRYLKAIQLRIDKLQHAAMRDQQHLRDMRDMLEQWQNYDQRLCQEHNSDERIDEIRWMLEELRISLFAQEVGTAYPVSLKRVTKRWRELGL